MTVRRDRNTRATLGFTIVWMTVLTSAILVAIWALGSAAWSGEPVALLFLVVWVGAAGYALIQVGRQLRRRFFNEPLPPRASRSRQWDDGIDPLP